MNPSAVQEPAMKVDAFPQPDPNEAGRPFWESLRGGALTFQRCNPCNEAWLPARTHCPNCLSDDWLRESAKGQARLISWVVYRMAYHPAFVGRLPYVVAVIELIEGPRMISNIVQAEPESLRIDMPLNLIIEEESGVSVPRFIPASTHHK